MVWLRRIGIALLVLIATAAGVYWYYLGDGAVPDDTTYTTDITLWRNLVANDTAELPKEIRVEVIGTSPVPFAAVQAGGALKQYLMARTAFELVGPSGSTIIDSGMDKELAGGAGPSEGATYDEAAYNRVIAAMGNAARVLVTHEHPDHIGGIARFPVPERLAERLTLTRKQLAGLARFAPGGAVPAAFDSAQLIEPTAPTRVAPGVVMIPAEGHTPGNVMFYVRLADGREVLFLGDVAWALSNVTSPALRPRAVQEFVMKPPEDRTKVAEQIRALHELSKREPALVLIPSHDDIHLKSLITSGLLKPGFTADAP
jgi:glyoxylase-like metal-dependent hydrolase (beta-lactamase superfamily II)